MIAERVTREGRARGDFIGGEEGNGPGRNGRERNHGVNKEFDCDGAAEG